MLHNKYFTILQHYSGDYVKELYGRELAKIVPLSQKNIALTLEELENEGVLKSRKKGSTRFYKLNTENQRIKDVLLIVETYTKISFFEKHPKIAHLFKNDQRIIGIFGSYVREREKKDSDIDVFIVGNKVSEDYNTTGASFDLDISIKYFSEKEFKQLLRKKNPLGKEIIKEHVLIFNGEKFIDCVWREHYGFT